MVGRRRWWIYLLIGSLFGIVDFYFQTLQWPGPPLVRVALVFGIWLLPLIPVAVNEARLSQRLWRPSVAGILTWSAAVVAYYFYLLLQLVLIRHPTRPEMHISSAGRDPYYLDNLVSVFVGEVLISGIAEWLGVAIIGGGILGRLIASACHRAR